MCVADRKYSYLIGFLQLLSWGLFIGGILIISVGRTDKCESYCYQSPCWGTDHRIYDCDCGNYCQNKHVVVDSVFRTGVALLVIGIFGSIFACILTCVMRRRSNQSLHIIANPNPPVYTYGQPVYAQGPPTGGMEPAKNDQFPTQNPQYNYNYGQQYPQNVAYGQPLPQNYGQPMPQNYGQPMPQNYGYGQQIPDNVAYGYPMQPPVDGGK